jgi:hypothetical protein
MKRHLILLALLGGAMGASYAAQTPVATQNGAAMSTICRSVEADTWPDWLQYWIDNGGPMPAQLVADVIHEAADWGLQTLHLTESEMLARYATGEIKIEFDPNALPILSFRVSAGGGDGIAVILDNF